MAIKISMEKTVDIDGNKKVQLAISNMLSSNQVPAEYRDSFPAVWLNGESLYVHTDNQERQDQYRNEYPANKTVIAEYLIRYEITPDLADYLLRKIQESGERLHTINTRIERERAMYSGKSEIII